MTEGYLGLRKRMTDEEIAALDPERLLMLFGPVAIGGREQEWKEICNRLYRLWELESRKPPVEGRIPV